jgi:hypothetical protein
MPALQGLLRGSRRPQRHGIVRNVKLRLGTVGTSRGGQKSAARMDESKEIVRLNIEHYQRLLATEPGLNKREAIAKLLAEQLAQLQEIERKERESIRRSGK